MYHINELPGQANPFKETDSPGECNRESDMGLNSNVKDAGHPIWSSEGIIELINTARQWGNTKEKDLSGEVSQETFAAVYDASQKTKIPGEVIMFCMDWDQDLTSGGGNATQVAFKLIDYAKQLRSTLGRDPMMGELLAAHAYGNAGTVKRLVDMAEQKPEEEAQPLGAKKDDIITKKLRNGKEVKRKWREMYDFFYRRMHRGKVTFSGVTGDTQTADAGIISSLINAVSPSTPKVDASNISNMGIRG